MLLKHVNINMSSGTQVLIFLLNVIHILYFILLVP